MPAPTSKLADESAIADVLNEHGYSARVLLDGSGIEVKIVEKGSVVRTLCSILCDERGGNGKRAHWIITANRRDTSPVRALANQIGSMFLLAIRLSWTDKKTP